MSLFELCQKMEETGISRLVREDPWMFPILVSIHILGLMLSVGLLLWFDLRLLGFGIRNGSVSRLYRRLMPWMIPGFFVMSVSGAMLFAGFATKAYVNLFFRVKLSALVVAGLNAAFFHLVTERRIAPWDESRLLPTAARVAGLISILAWTMVILAGRMTAYTMY